MEPLQFEIAFYNISFGLKNRVKFVSHTTESATNYSNNTEENRQYVNFQDKPKSRFDQVSILNRFPSVLNLLS